MPKNRQEKIDALLRRHTPPPPKRPSLRQKPFGFNQGLLKFLRRTGGGVGLVIIVLMIGGAFWLWQQPDPLPPSQPNVLLFDDNRDGRITCAELRRHKVAPIDKNHPVYPFMIDGDRDGVVCE